MCTERWALPKSITKEFTASEMAYLTGPSKDKLIPVLLHTLSMSFSSDVIGTYDSSVFLCLGGGGWDGIMGSPPKLLDFIFSVGIFPHKYT